MDDLMRLAKLVDIRQAIKVWTEKGGDEARSTHCSENSKSYPLMREKF